MSIKYEFMENHFFLVFSDNGWNVSSSHLGDLLTYPLYLPDQFRLLDKI